MTTEVIEVGSVRIQKMGDELHIRDRPGQGGDRALLLVGGLGLALTAFVVLAAEGGARVFGVVVGVALLGLAAGGIVSRLRGSDTIVVDRAAGTVSRGSATAAQSGTLGVETTKAITYRRDDDGHQVGDGYPVWSTSITDGHQTVVVATSKRRVDIERVTQIIEELLHPESGT